MSVEITYEPNGAQLVAHLLSEARFSLIQGPRGSAKSTNSCIKLCKNAVEQPPGPDGVRYRRTYIIRQTYDELKRTTLDTWLQQFPEDRFGKVRREKPYTHHIRLPGLDWEVVFLAVEDEADLRKILSANISDAWVNEFREVPRKVFDDLDAIVGRYPNETMGGRFRPQIIGDTNAPRADHWWAYMSGQSVPPADLPKEERARLVKPANWEIFLQPPALLEEHDEEGEVSGYRLNPEAENLRYVGADYYTEMIKGKTRSWIRVNCLNKPALLHSGKPVWPTFRDEAPPRGHVAREPMAAVEGVPVFVGLDFGRSPAAVFGQRVFDNWRVLFEATAEDVGAKTFARIVSRILGERYAGHDYLIYGDPTGSSLSQADDSSPFLMFRAAGLHVRPAPSNDPDIRTAAVEELLNASPDGVPRLVLSPSCVRLRAAMAGDYHYKAVRGATGEIRDTPAKNAASHIADALQYMVIGAGEGRALLQQSRGGTAWSRPVQARVARGWSRFGRGAARRA